MPTVLVSGTDAVTGARLVRQHLAARWTVAGVPIFWPNEVADLPAYKSVGYIRAFIQPAGPDQPISQRRQATRETTELIVLWIHTPEGVGRARAVTWYTALARALESTTLEPGCHIYECSMVDRAGFEGMYRVDLIARMVRTQVTRLEGYQPPIEGVSTMQGLYAGHGFAAAALPAPFAWAGGVPVVPTLTGAVGDGAVGIVSAVSGDLVTWHGNGQVVRMVHNLGAEGPRWMNASGALVATEPVGWKQIVLEVVDATTLHVLIGSTYT